MERTAGILRTCIIPWSRSSMSKYISSKSSTQHIKLQLHHAFKRKLEHGNEARLTLPETNPPFVSSISLSVCFSHVLDRPPLSFRAHSPPLPVTPQLHDHTPLSGSGFWMVASDIAPLANWCRPQLFFLWHILKHNHFFKGKSWIMVLGR